MELKVLEPSRVTVMIKPVGALCNLDCTYCYYLPTKTVYDGHEHRMSLATLEELFAGLIPNFSDDMTIAWQGGEPTLAGLDFFRKAIEFQNKYKRPEQVIRHAIQTNGTLLDDDWCRFLNENKFLVGFSIDGPPKFHDHYRVTNSGEGSSTQVFRGLKKLQAHNVDHPDEVFDYMLSLGTPWMQFIPCVEWEKDADGNNVLAPYSPDPEAYGRFLCRVFDRWFEKYRHRISIRIFDAALNKLVLGEMPFCILNGMCHNQLTVEHDGSVFGCDHFIERRWQLARIGEPGWRNNIRLDGTEQVGLTIHGDGYRKNAELPGRDIHSSGDVPVEDQNGGDQLDNDWLDRVDSSRLASFAVRKQNLPQLCLDCRYKRFCYGGCPKHRSQGGETAEPTILCAGYMMFYDHAMQRLEWLAGFLRQNRQPPPPEDTRDRKKRKKAKA